MALQAGFMAVTIEYAKDLKDVHWVGRQVSLTGIALLTTHIYNLRSKQGDNCDVFPELQDPYVVLRCGNQSFRSKTAKDAGTNPVWVSKTPCKRTSVQPCKHIAQCHSSVVQGSCASHVKIICVEG